MAHINYAIDFTVACYIVKAEQVLLIFHRGLHKWLPVGGHIDPGEDPDQALLREIWEETGLDVNVVAERAAIKDDTARALYTPAHVNIHHITDTHSHVVNIYYARWAAGEPVLAEKEHEQIKWFSKSELLDPNYGIKPDVLWYAEDALAKLSASRQSI